MGSDYGRDEWPRQPTIEWLAARYGEFHKRLRVLEDRDDKYDPKVTNLRLQNIEDDLKIVKRALYGLMFVIVAASVTFSFTVFSLLGHS